MRKTFDCVEMKRRIQEEVYVETKGLSPDQELEYFHQADERFWKEISDLRRNQTKVKTTLKID